MRALLLIVCVGLLFVPGLAPVDSPVAAGDGPIWVTPVEYEDDGPCLWASLAWPNETHTYTSIDDHAPTLEQLRAGAAFMAEEIGRGGGVYVHCGSGIGRAPTMAAAYLVGTGLTPDQAWARIRAVRPFIRPKPAQVAQVERFARERTGGRL